MTTKYQHIIPAWYIAWFSETKQDSIRDSLIYYYDKRSKKIIHNKASNILWEDWYFEVDYKFFLIDKSIIDEQKFINLVEKEICGIEGAFLNITDKINEGWSSISDDDKNMVINYALHLFMRTKRMRKEAEERWRSLLEKKYWKNFTNIDAIEKHKLLLLSQWHDPTWLDKHLSKEWIEKYAQMMSSRWVLWHLTNDYYYDIEFKNFSRFTFHFFRIKGDDEFISSDNPVILGKRCIIFPIDKKTCLIGATEKINLTLDYINRAIASTADNVIFASNDKLLKKYIEFISRKDWGILMHLDKELQESDFHKIFELSMSEFI